MRRWFVYLLSCAFFVILLHGIGYAGAADSPSLSISSYGQISYPGSPSPPGSANLVFSTDFSDLYIVTEGTSRPNQFQYLNGSSFPMRQNVNYSPGTAHFEIIDDPMASGGKSVFMEVFDNQATSTRLELNWYIGDLEGIDDEYYVLTVLKFPDGYHLDHPADNPGWWGWHQIANPASEWTATNPDDYKMHLNIDQTASGHKLTLTLRTETTRTVYYQNSVQFVPPSGWFTIGMYVKRHPTDGIVKIWVDGTQYFDVSGVRTMDLSDFYVQLAKLYGGEVMPAKQLWVDYVAIYDGLPF